MNVLNIILILTEDQGPLSVVLEHQHMMENWYMLIL